MLFGPREATTFLCIVSKMEEEGAQVLREELAKEGNVANMTPNEVHVHG